VRRQLTHCSLLRRHHRCQFRLVVAWLLFSDNLTCCVHCLFLEFVPVAGDRALTVAVLITDLYSTFKSEDTEVLDAAQED